MQISENLIIDDKCKNYWNGNCSNSKNELIGACDDFPDCYYKQLKILEKEAVIRGYALEAARKEKEFLKGKIIHLERFSNDLISKYVKPICEPSLNIEILNEKERYNTTLQNIKDIVNKECEICVGKNSENYCNNCDCINKDIIKKISEVIK